MSDFRECISKVNKCLNLVNEIPTLCSICFENDGYDPHIVVCKNGHSFCSSCVLDVRTAFENAKTAAQSYKDTNPSCPLCNTQMFTDGEESVDLIKKTMHAMKPLLEETMSRVKELEARLNKTHVVNRGGVEHTQFVDKESFAEKHVGSKRNISDLQIDLSELETIVVNELALERNEAREASMLKKLQARKRFKKALYNRQCQHTAQNPSYLIVVEDQEDEEGGVIHDYNSTAYTPTRLSHPVSPPPSPVFRI